jgi:hypothetical protein
LPCGVKSKCRPARERVSRGNADKHARRKGAGVHRRQRCAHRMGKPAALDNADIGCHPTTRIPTGPRRESPGRACSRRAGDNARGPRTRRDELRRATCSASARTGTFTAAGSRAGRARSRLTSQDVPSHDRAFAAGLPLRAPWAGVLKRTASDPDRSAMYSGPSQRFGFAAPMRPSDT